MNFSCGKGQFYPCNHRRIEIDLTYECNLACSQCNRSCAQAPSQKRISCSQVKRFILQSILRKRKWERIKVLGGEPTLHPQIMKILAMLIAYKKGFSPDTKIILATNGAGEKVRRVLSCVPQDVEVLNADSVNRSRFQFTPFNAAPIDDPAMKGFDFSRGCAIPRLDGIGLTPSGYYHCAIAGGIDRVFGLRLGQETLPRSGSNFIAARRRTCCLCGHFRDGVFPDELTRRQQEVSPSWKDAYALFRRHAGKVR